MFERLTTGPRATILGAVLLIVGGIAVVAHAQIVGTIIAAAGGLLVVRERVRQRGGRHDG